MADINWGLLGDMQQMAPIRSATPQASGGSAPLLSGGGGQDPTAYARLQLDQQRLAMDKQNQQFTQSQDTKRLANETQAAADVHSTFLQDQALKQYNMQIRQASMKAYNDAKQKGGDTYAAFNASAQAMASMGDMDSATKLLDSTSKLRQAAAENNQKNMAATGGVLFDISKKSQSTIDPKTGQQIPAAQNALQLYTKEFEKGVKPYYPDAPDPKSFKNNQQFEDTFLHPALEIALPSTQQEANRIAEQQKNQMFQANNLVNDSWSKVQDAVKTYGKDSPEAKMAAQNYQAAVDNRRKLSKPESIVETLKGLASTPNAQDVINTAAQENQGGMPTTPSAPTSSVANTANAALFNPEEIQAELARRAGTQGK